MPLRSYKPTSPGRRGMTRSTFEEITTTEPYKPLLEPQKRGSGRNNQGRLTVRHRGGGEKTHYRRIDFKRDKHGVPARIATVEYDPNRSARIGLLHYRDGEKRYMLLPHGLQGRRRRRLGRRARRRGSATPCRSRTSRSAPRSTTSSSSRARAARSSAPRAPRPSCWPRRASTPRSACRPARSAGSASAAWPPSARSATSITRTRTSARPVAPATWASDRRSGASS